MNYSNSPDVGFTTGSLAAMASSPAPETSPIQNRLNRVHESGERLHLSLSRLEARLEPVAPAGEMSHGESNRDKEIGPSCGLEATILDVETMVNIAFRRVDSLISRLKL